MFFIAVLFFFLRWDSKVFKCVFKEDLDPSELWDGDECFSENLVRGDRVWVRDVVCISFGGDDGLLVIGGDANDAMDHGDSVFSELDDVALFEVFDGGVLDEGNVADLECWLHATAVDDGWGHPEVSEAEEDE